MQGTQEPYIAHVAGSLEKILSSFQIFTFTVNLSYKYATENYLHVSVLELSCSF